MLEERIQEFNIPDFAQEEVLSLLEDIKPLHIPHLTQKQEYAFFKAMEETIDGLDMFAEEDFSLVINAIRSAPAFPPDLRFTVALLTPQLVQAQGIRGIGNYVRYVQPVTDRSVFAAAGFSSLTKEELDASPISLDALRYATARAAMYSGYRVISINTDGEPSINGKENIVNISRSLLEELGAYPQEDREEMAHAVLPFYCAIAPKIRAVNGFLRRFGTVYQASPSLARPFGVACARLRHRGESFHKAIEVAANTPVHVDNAGVPDVIAFWESLAKLSRPHWSIIAQKYAIAGDEALLQGNWSRMQEVFDTIKDLKSGKEVYKIVDSVVGKE